MLSFIKNVFVQMTVLYMFNTVELYVYADI